MRKKGNAVSCWQPQHVPDVCLFPHLGCPEAHSDGSAWSGGAGGLGAGVWARTVHEIAAKMSTARGSRSQPYLEAVLEFPADEVESHGVDAGVEGGHVDPEIIHHEEETETRGERRGWELAEGTPEGGFPSYLAWEPASMGGPVTDTRQKSTKPSLLGFSSGTKIFPVRSIS